MSHHEIIDFHTHPFLDSDQNICTPPVFIGGVLHDPLITEDERELILSGNAKRLLEIL